MPSGTCNPVLEVIVINQNKEGLPYLDYLVGYCEVLTVTLTQHAGVPISTQWDPRGHFYPVQIAQFGLSHFSKNLSEPAPTVTLLENGIRSQHGSWVASSKGRAGYSRVLDKDSLSHVVEFKTSGTSGPWDWFFTSLLCHYTGKRLYKEHL